MAAPVLTNSCMLCKSSASHSVNMALSYSLEQHGSGPVRRIEILKTRTKCGHLLPSLQDALWPRQFVQPTKHRRSPTPSTRWGREEHHNRYTCLCGMFALEGHTTTSTCCKVGKQKALCAETRVCFGIYLQVAALHRIKSHWSAAVSEELLQTSTYVPHVGFFEMMQLYRLCFVPLVQRVPNDSRPLSCQYAR